MLTRLSLYSSALYAMTVRKTTTDHAKRCVPPPCMGAHGG